MLKSNNTTTTRNILAKTRLVQWLWLLILIVSLSVHLVDEFLAQTIQTVSGLVYAMWLPVLIHGTTWLFGFVIIRSAKSMLFSAIANEQELLNKSIISEQRYRQLFNQMSVGFAVHEIIVDDAGVPCDYRFLEVNRAFENMTGLIAENIIGKSVLEVLPDTEKCWIEQFGAVALTQTPAEFEQYSRELDCWYQVSVYSPQKGQFAVLVTDVTERDKMAEALREYQYVIENSNDMIISLDENHRYLMANRKFLEVRGLTLDDVIGKTPEDILGRDLYISIVKPNLDKAFQGNATTFFINYDNAASTGRRMQVTYQPMLNDDGIVKRVFGFVVDMTERLELEEQLRQSQRLEAIGTLAGGVAHDFNNILTVIMGAASYLQSMLPDESELKPFASQIVSSSERAAKLTQSLLAFSRKQAMQVEYIDINEMVVLIHEFLGAILGENVSMEISRSQEPLHICADRGQIEQVLMNLVVNARDAMPKGGTIRVATSMVDSSAISGDSETIMPGKYVCIEVADTGTGMTDKIKARIFEPFFTTKDVGQGTGLGLSVVHGIIHQHHGAITVESTPGEGTIFKAYLPLAANGCNPFSIESPESVAGGNETLLLVEDDSDVRFMNRVILENAGYTVLEAGNAEEALRVLHHKGNVVKLIVMDLMMPGMDGKELADLCHSFLPTVPVLFVTGYGAETLGQKGIVTEQVNLLQKPLNLNQFLHKVRNMLDERQQ